MGIRSTVEGALLAVPSRDDLPTERGA